jgi:hypothetical protein
MSHFDEPVRRPVPALPGDRSELPGDPERMPSLPGIAGIKLTWAAA